MAALAVALAHVVDMATYYLADATQEYRNSEDGELDQQALDLVAGLTKEMEGHYAD